MTFFRGLKIRRHDGFLNRNDSGRFSLWVVFSVGFFVVTIFGLIYFLDLIYDDDIAQFVTRPVLFLLLLILIFLLYINLILILRIIIKRIQKKAGSFIRSKIIGFFSLSIFIPLLIFSMFWIHFFDQILSVIDGEAITDTLSSKLINYREMIQQKEKPLKENFFTKLEQGHFEITGDDQIDYLSVYDVDGNLIFFNRKKKLLKDSLDDPFPFDPSFVHLPFDHRKQFFSYSEEEGLIYFLYRSQLVISSSQQNPLVITNHYAAFQIVDPTLKVAILDNLELIKKFRQLDVLIYPTSVLILLIFVYLYLQTYSIAVIIFYYRSMSYTKPIEALIITTKQMSAGAWNEINLKPFIKGMGENEIKQLLKSFSNMIQDFIDHKKRLNRLSNLEAWKEVATRLAHELKNPLTPIKLATNEIESYLSLKDIQTYADLQSKFQFIHNEVERIEGLVKDFSHLSNQIDIRPHWFPIQELIDSGDSYLAHYPKIELKKEILWQGEVFLDLDKMKLVIINLIQNSIDSILTKEKKTSVFSPRIEIYFSRQSHINGDGQDRFQQKQKSGFVLEVRDNGAGVSPNKREEIFKPYVTFKKSGTGLGLAICEEIIRLHHGSISCNEVRNFTCFMIFLPDQIETVKK